MAYTYPQQNEKTVGYIFTGLVALGIILLFTGPSSLGAGLLASSFLWLGFGIGYTKLNGADYIVTHYKSENAIRAAQAGT